jgi:hypothetical protein
MKKVLIAAVVTFSLAACGGNNNPDRIERNADSVMPAQPDAPMNSDTTYRSSDSGQMHQNPGYHPDTLMRK